MAFVVRSEVRQLVSLVLLVRRRRQGVPTGATAIGYDRALRPLHLVVLFVSVVELVAVELALPWPTARLVLRVLGGYTLLFVLGLIASAVVRPHVIGDGQLRLRSGAWADVRVPLVHSATVTAGLRDAPDRTVAVSGAVLSMGVGGATNVELRLPEPAPVVVRNRTHLIQTVRFAADEPAAAVTALKGWLAALNQRSCKD